MVKDNNADFAPVNLLASLAEPEGFYSKYNQINAARRKLVLLRLPQNLALSSLQGAVLRGTGTKRPFGVIKNEKGACQVRCSGEKPSAALAVPGVKGLAMEPFGEVWTVERLVEGTTEVESAPVDFDGDVGGGAKGRKRPQPEGLAMNLSATDFASVINRTRRKRPATTSSTRTS